MSPSPPPPLPKERGGRLVIASNNAGKLAELSAILGPLGFETVPQGALGVPEADEPHHTFVENALAKARNCARHTGLPALADDSGLCVEALGGAPGCATTRRMAATDKETPARRSGQGSPSTTLRRSATIGSAASRSQFTLIRCLSLTFAPQTKSARRAADR